MRVFTVLQVHKLNYEKSLILHLDVTVKPRLVHWRLILGVNFNVLVLIFAIWFSVSSIHHAVQKGTNLLNQIDTITLVANTIRLNLNNTYTSSKKKRFNPFAHGNFPEECFLKRLLPRRFLVTIWPKKKQKCQRRSAGFRSDTAPGRLQGFITVWEKVPRRTYLRRRKWTGR